MRIKFSRMDWEEACLEDIINGNGFYITEPPFADIDKSIKNMYGSRSPLYGSEINDKSENIIQDRWSCECGRLTGSMFEGEVCPNCGKPVEFRETDILYTGWLSLGPTTCEDQSKVLKIINPLWFQRMQSALSKKNLENIISNENIITSNGIIRRHDEQIESKKGSLIYHNIGLTFSARDL